MSMRLEVAAVSFFCPFPLSQDNVSLLVLRSQGVSFPPGRDTPLTLRVTRATKVRAASSKSLWKISSCASTGSFCELAFVDCRGVRALLVSRGENISQTKGGSSWLSLELSLLSATLARFLILPIRMSLYITLYITFTTSRTSLTKVCDEKQHALSRHDTNAIAIIDIMFI